MSDQFIVKEVLNGTVAEFGTLNPLAYFDYASTTNTDVKTQRVEVRGGQGNYLLGVMDHSKAVTTTLTFPVVDLKFVALLNGDTLAEQVQNVMQRDSLTVGVISTGTINVTAGATTAGNATVSVNGTAYNVAILATDSANAVAGKIQAVLVTVPNVNATVTGSTVTATVFGSTATTMTFGAGSTGATATATVTSSNGVQLKKTPIAGQFNIYDLIDERDYGGALSAGSPDTTPKTYNLSGQLVSLNATSHPVGAKVVALYQYATASNAKKVTIKANKFAKTIVLFGDGWFYDQVLEEEVAVKVQMYKVKPQGNMTFTMEGTKATDLVITCDLMAVDLPNGDKGFMEYVVIPDEEA